MSDLLTPTAKILYQKYGKLVLRLGDLAKETDYASGLSIHQAIDAGTFPIRTFMLGRFRVCDIRDLADYLDQQEER